MKRLLPLFCILVALIASTGVACAEPPQPYEFTITGYNIPEPPPEPLPSGRIKFDLAAEGSVTGDLVGNFTFVEQGNVVFSQELSVQGTNHGVLTIATEDGQAIIRFDGQVSGSIFEQVVTGTWRVLKSDNLDRVQAQGTYVGSVFLDKPFTVTFIGKFH